MPSGMGIAEVGVESGLAEQRRKSRVNVELVESCSTCNFRVLQYTQYACVGQRMAALDLPRSRQRAPDQRSHFD